MPNIVGAIHATRLDHEGRGPVGEECISYDLFWLPPVLMMQGAKFHGTQQDASPGVLSAKALATRRPFKAVATHKADMRS